MIVTTFPLSDTITWCSYNAAGQESVYILDWCVFVVYDMRPYLIQMDRLIPLAYEALLLVLAMYRATAFWKANGVHGSRLVWVLVKDQVVYFLL